MGRHRRPRSRWLRRVTLLIDTSGLLVYLDAAAAGQQACAAIVEAEDELVLSPFVLAEADYLINRRLGAAAALRLLADVAAGAYRLASFDQDDVQAAGTVLQRFEDLGVGLTDASLVVLADRHQTGRILTFDERHFRALRWARRRAFTLLPKDD
ncbi:MAG: PIN domain-containing protein [Nitriliruptorales bacterium]|nr:PIN domain-containing protein [Nitriliruptorales bacterium]